MSGFFVPSIIPRKNFSATKKSFQKFLEGVLKFFFALTRETLSEVDDKPHENYEGDIKFHGEG